MNVRTKVEHVDHIFGNSDQQHRLSLKTRYSIHSLNPIFRLGNKINANPMPGIGRFQIPDPQKSILISGCFDRFRIARFLSPGMIIEMSHRRW